jgi:hypothetical protein
VTPVFNSIHIPSNALKTFMKMLLSTIAIAALIALPLTGMTAEAVKQSTNPLIPASAK